MEQKQQKASPQKTTPAPQQQFVPPQPQPQPQPQQQQQQMPSYAQMGFSPYGGYGAQAGSRAHHGNDAKRLPTKGWDKSKPVSSVIVTVFSSSSYDGLFREVEQEPPEPGVAVSLFQLSYECLPGLLKAMKGENIDSEPSKEIFQDICADVSRAEPHSVVLNFECCGHCSESGFGNGSKTTVMPLIKLFVERQHMVMFADFSVKAMIRDWDASLLGPNPFFQIGQCSGNFDLAFSCDALRASPSAQLATVANLCADGHAHVHALGGTVVFTVNPASTDTPAYKLEVLSVTTNVDGHAVEPGGKRLVTLPSNKEKKGAVGHALLRYPSPKAGGQEGYMLFSMGHWIELARLDVKLESVLKHAELNYGKEYAANLNAQYMASAPAEREAQVQCYARAQVQKASPAYYGNSSAWVAQQEAFSKKN